MPGIPLLAYNHDDEGIARFSKNWKWKRLNKNLKSGKSEIELPGIFLLAYNHDD